MVGGVGFFALAPADGQPADGAEPTEAGSAGNEAASDPQDEASDDESPEPEEQPIYDLAAAWQAQDCTALLEASLPGFWDFLFQTSDENEAMSACETAFASGQVPEVTLHDTTVLQGDDQVARVSVDATGWHEDLFWVSNKGGTWKVNGADKALEGDAGGEGSESGGGSYDQPSGRPVTEPEDPPSGNADYDTLASECHGGNMVACDDLYWEAPRGSDYEIYGTTCGGRRLGVFAGGQCETDFNRNIED